jgi:hypothetical protein
MEALLPWAKLLAVIEPFYPKGERGRPPVGLERMLRSISFSNGMAWPTKACPAPPRS